MADSKNTSQPASTAVTSNQRKWPADKDLPAVLSSRARAQDLATQETGLTGRDVRPLRNKPLQLERDLWECVVLCCQEWGNYPENKAKAPKVPNLEQLLQPPKGFLIRVNRKEGGQWVPKDVVAADELKERMGALYLDYTTNAKLGKDGFYWCFITYLNAGPNHPLAVLSVEIAKNLHRYSKNAKPIPVQEWWGGESESNIVRVQPTIAPAAKK